MTTIALFGDSTFETSYLLASANPALVTYHGKAAGFDGRLNAVLQSSLAALGVDVTVGNHGFGGMDSSEALSTVFSNPSKWAACVATSPDVVVLNFGINDSTEADTPVPTFYANIQQMIDDAVVAGIVPVLCTSPWVAYPLHAEYDRNAIGELGKYNDALVMLAIENHLTLIDNRKAFYDSIAAGVWDLFGHNDATYLDSWAALAYGTVAPDPLYYTNIHPWIDGVQLMADTMAERLLTEPILGGAAPTPYPSFLYDVLDGGLMAAEPTPIADWQVQSDGTVKNVLNGVLATITGVSAIPNARRWSNVRPGGGGWCGDFTGAALCTLPTTDWNYQAGTFVLVMGAPSVLTETRPLWWQDADATDRLFVVTNGGDYGNIRFSTKTIAGYANADSARSSSAPCVVACRYNGLTGKARAFVNGAGGTEITTFAAPEVGMKTTAVLGSSAINTFPFGGPIARLLVYSRELTDEEILSLNGYERGVGGTAPARKALVIGLL